MAQVSIPNTALTQEQKLRSQIVIDGRYRHYKGKEYTVLGIARHSETLELMVFYRAEYDSELGRNWVRPLSMFLEPNRFSLIK